MVKKIFIAFIAVFFFVFNIFPSDFFELENILKKTKTYCEKLKNESIKFYCNEKIYELIYIPPRKIHHRKGIREKQIKNTYLYDYQLIKTGTKKLEKRFILKINGKKVKKREKKITTWLKHSFVIMGPYGIFGEEWQEKFNYKIIGRKMYKGQKIIIIDAVPKNRDNIDHMWGKAWIREKDYSILKIEWDQSSVKKLINWKDRIKGINAVPRFSFISEYEIKHNGLMLPSRYTFLERYFSNTKGYKIIKSMTKVRYYNYKFFMAEIEDIKIERSDIVDQ